LIYILLNSNSFQVGLTPKNAKDVEALVNRVIEGEALALSIALNLRKLQKFAVELSTNTIIQNSVNKELLGQLKKEDDKRKRVAAGDKNLIGYRRYIGEEVLKERQDWAGQKYFDETWAVFRKLGIGLIGHPKVQKKAPKLSGRGNVKAFTALWKEFATTPEFNIFTIDVVTSWTLDSWKY
jgi:hypothetical protein